MLKLHLDTDLGGDIDDLLKLEIKDGWLYQRIDSNGKPTRVVTRVNGDKFNEFWLGTAEHA